MSCQIHKTIIIYKNLRIILKKRIGKKIRLFGNLAFNKDGKLYYFYKTRFKNK